MYSIDDLKELINAVDNSSVTNFIIKGSDGEKIVIKKEIKIADANPYVQTVETNVNSGNVKVEENKTNAENYKIIKSPMIGVFYSASSPDAEPFVKVGSVVSVGDTVCIIEAMKLMNEVQSDTTGEIVEVCVSNGDVVEYGQTLFKVR